MDLKLFEKMWKPFFFTIIFLWLLVISSILYLVITGTQPLIDTSVNLFYVTLPILVLSLLYFFLTLFIFAVYLLTFGKVKNKQLIAMRRRVVTDKHPLHKFTNTFQTCTILNNHERMVSIGNHEMGSQKEPGSLGMREEDDLCSIIIAARNEDSVIRRTVMDCLKQTYKKIEVIVVCHNCTDRTYEEARVYDARVHAFEFKTKAAGKGIALNFGVDKAKGKYLLILDADGLLNHEFIQRATPLFDDGYAAVQGRYIPSNRDYSLITKLLAIEGDIWSTPYLTARAFLDKRCGLGGTGYVIRKDILIGVGGFANHLVDDYELTCRLLKENYKIGFAPLCINYDEKPPNLEIMLKQRARWAKGFLDLLKRRATGFTDILGFLFWLTPIAGFCGFVMLTITAFAAIYNLIFEYYPYYFASIPVDLWIILTGLLYASQATSLIKQYGRRGLRYAAYIPIYNVFVLYFFVTLIRAFTIKSWANTKTTHGFMKPSESITVRPLVSDLEVR
jgi:cellulose synthase/poly-beta-1,6-N-acetylglucosamine synthase-like glycosyltransferase